MLVRSPMLSSFEMGRNILPRVLTNNVVRPQRCGLRKGCCHILSFRSLRSSLLNSINLWLSLKFYLLCFQTEIAKRLSALINQLVPFLSQEHQQQVLTAVERAKQITMTELNAVIGVTVHF